MTAVQRILWLQSPPWDGVWTRQNHFARRFAKNGVEILYVENPPAFRARAQLEGIGISSLLGGKSREVEPRLRVLKLPLQIPGSRQIQLLGATNGLRFAWAVNRELQASGWSDYVAWCRVPNAFHTLRHLKPSAVVYDVTDDYELYARSQTEKTLTRQLEQKLLRRANQVFTTTTILRDKFSGLAQKIDVIPNGVDSVFFEEPVEETDPLPSTPRPRIGFVGLVARWMDFELLRKLASRWPGQVVIVGPVQAEVEPIFRSIRGIVHVPKVAHLEVPRYLRAFDVCIMPHIVSELRHRADPLKVIEYLAVGKPIVSVALRPLIEMNSLVDLADNHDEFLQFVESRLTDPRPELRQMRRNLAASRNWNNLYDHVQRSLNLMLASTGRLPLYNSSP